MRASERHASFPRAWYELNAASNINEIEPIAARFEERCNRAITDTDRDDKAGRGPVLRTSRGAEERCLPFNLK
ncbi:hypothetical protein EVAR_97994_1 [Eumeta japonica]|uniref:Uncharacterized protein n=1 Tax=Eumeta variegata TaxID=151549 RepID=A0A4C1WJZ7_EUMVA|nr:hypothetical protein EVAR_97994_1 [Eumeta japonica]